MTNKHIVELALPVPLHKRFDYKFDHSANSYIRLAPGMRVLAPFGRRHLIGVVTAVKTDSQLPASKLKTIIQCLDQQPLFNQQLLDLYHWASDYYHYPLGGVIAAALPRLLRQSKQSSYSSHGSQSRIDYWQLTEEGRNLSLDTLKRATKQQALIAYMQQSLPQQALSGQQLRQQGATADLLRKLQQKHLIAPSLEKNSLTKPSSQQQRLTLNDDQQQAVNSIKSCLNQFKVFLLEGITGSGKTEVYLQSIEKAIEQNLNTLLLVPEISLTPQMIKRFQQRFDHHSLVLLHSQLSDKQRCQAWLKATTGDAKIVIGTRSAILTPIDQLGLIIIDESHDLSYKQQDSFRYSARDLAIRRGQMAMIPVVLGSATPALESLLNVQLNRYQHLSLPQRVGSTRLPSYRLIDIRKQPLEGGLSPLLLTAISQHLSQGRQVLLFLNRRGFAPTVMCQQCGWIADCQRCDSHMVLHQQQQRLHCHHCGYSQALPSSCPQCHTATPSAIGVGTERLEQTLSKHFQQYDIARIDRDTTRHKGSLDQLLNKINRGQAQILIGTQMLAKGHHFPNVTLVAIINADGGFFSADFRAVERMGQLLTQVAGRAGRGEQSGEVWIQSYQPDHPLLQTLINQGYASFAKQLLIERQACQLPPYYYFALLRAESTTETAAIHFLRTIKAQLNSTLSNELENSAELLGPISATMPKRAGRYRGQLLIQSAKRQSLHHILSRLCDELEQMKISRTVRWSLDIDPQEMF